MVVAVDMWLYSVLENVIFKLLIKLIDIATVLHYSVFRYQNVHTASFIGFSVVTVASISSFNLNGCNFVPFGQTYGFSQFPQSSPLSVKHSSNILTHFSVSAYPVDDFRLKGADDAAVVEDWMFLIQFFKGCSCLGGEDKHMVIVGQSTVYSVCEALCHCVCSCTTTCW